jgi:hypothetical protein
MSIYVINNVLLHFYCEEDGWGTIYSDLFIIAVTLAFVCKWSSDFHPWSHVAQRQFSTSNTVERNLIKISPVLRNVIKLNVQKEFKNSFIASRHHKFNGMVKGLREILTDQLYWQSSRRISALASYLEIRHFTLLSSV